MECRIVVDMTTNTATITDTSNQATGAIQADADLQAKILRTIDKKSFCTLATTSDAGFGHAAGVIYDAVDGTLWFHTMRNSRKARNIAANHRVGVTIPFRKLPMGPPFTIQFQANARLVDLDSPEIASLVERGELKPITGHGELDMAGSCFVAIEPRGSINSFGPGAKLLDLIRDPLNSGARTFRLDPNHGVAR